MLHPDMLEATRLTRSGRLAEATALLRRIAGVAKRVATPQPKRSSPGTGWRPGIDLDLKPLKRGPQPARQSDRSDPRFLAGRHVSEHGALDYRLYVPATAAPGAALIVMLHGCTQSAEDFAAGTGMNKLADERGLLVLYPAQPRSANAQKCWNWFEPRHQQRGGGEPAMIAALTAHVRDEHRIDPNRIFIAGLSAGGAAAAIMGEAYPELYAAVGVHSGLACGAASNLPTALAAMRQGPRAQARGSATPTPTIVFHGDSDATVHASNVAAITARAAADATLATTTETGTAASGRTFTRILARDASGKLYVENWTLHGGGHAWSGGSSEGSYTDPAGPDASREMLRFFLDRG